MTTTTTTTQATTQMKDALGVDESPVARSGNDAQPTADGRGSGGRLKKVLKWTGLTLVVLVAAAILIAVWFFRRPWPQVSGELAVVGLKAPVEVLRDARGVPHIYAENDHDLLFAQGFVHAQDRLWSMDHIRRLASGRLSEVIGPPAKRSDRYLRTLGLVQAAEQDLQGLEPETLELLQAYCDGVNAFLRQGTLPVEFTVFGYQPEPWQPLDILLRGKLMAWLTAENFMFEMSRARLLANLSPEQVQELFPPYQDGAPVIVPPGVDGYAWLKDSDLSDLDGGLEDALGGPTANWGSNQWSVHGDRTASGQPIFANDTHLVNALPSVWYHIGLHGGSFDVVGTSLPGVPLVIMGTNGKIAWGVTDMLPDVQDFYVEELDDPDRVDPEGPQRYKVDGEWQDLEIRTETVEVKGAEPFTFDVLHTANGPIMNDVIGRLKDFPHPLALRWAEHEPNQLLDAVVALNRAQDYESFRAALSRWHGPHMNFGYADVDGNVAYQSTGKVPIRAEGHQGLMPQPGQTSASRWQGFIPYEDLPHSLNPESGLVYTANHKVVDESYPYHLAHEWSDPYRAYRIEEMFGDRTGLGLDDMQEMQRDTKSLHAEKMRPLMLQARAETELEKEALALAEAWDLRNEISSRGAAAYQAWYRFLVRATFGDELGDELLDEYEDYYWVHGPVLEAQVARGTGGDPSPWFDDVSTEAVESDVDTSTRALKDAVTWLRDNLGDDPQAWTWGAMHTTTFIHQPIGLSGIPVVDGLVNSEPIPTPGDRFTVNAAWFATYQSKPFATSGGVSQRMIIDLSNLDASRYIQSSGQSGHLFHPQRLDQIEPWRDGVYEPLMFTRPAVEQRTVAELTLKPAG